MPLRLIIEDDEGSTTVVPLALDAVTIGRQQGNTIQLTEKNVSRRHARLYPESELWIIEDLGSYNGIKVNGVAVDSRHNIKEGDVVQIGDYHLALTEDVAKQTLNFPANAQAAPAANVRPEPMIASSSTELPQLSHEEIVALQSGQHAPAQPESVPLAAPSFEENKRGTSLLIGFGVLVVAVVGLAVVWMGVTDTDEDPQSAAAAEPIKKKAKAAPPKAPPPEPEPAVLEPPPPPPPEPVETPVIEDPTPVEPEVEAAPTTPIPEPKVRRPRRSTPKPKAPTVDTSALLSEARMAALKNPRKCYDLAQEAYTAKHSRAASEQMAVCACRIPDAKKAKRAVARLKGGKRDQIVKMCQAKGIDV